ncbi:TetR/AcrR family transcriptional regulator [Nocardia neocaledoniensis]|uniref:TetR/AcrR family transcriptional regulator n=1 Tax=Nocardia neocaledoniensis TaxID=236511 RepID=UPI0024554C47|nr:TetR/AcrR family transcriptional regulator [Nocardia neocaledoniensis]
MPTTVELLWGTAQRPTRGPKPALTLDGIVASAIALADAEGLAGLSMQRLAQGLGFTKMSLYRYVPGKEQLTALMLDTAMGTPPEPGGKGWRADLRAWVEAIFARYRTHPWTIELTLGLRPIGPNELSWTEAALTATEGTGLTGPERLDTIVLLNGHARSLAQQVDSVGDGANDQVVEQFTAMMGAAGDRFPAVSAAFAEEAASTSGANDAFDFGVERILDGLAVLIERRGSGL